ncbi:Ldh family oxidoreductase [Oceanobacillus timonensis]|uniref:Ldh family oxidoreductase n=1 Tax=Oceanobacillus timonensis TaxID=1926285 RepID=UPI0009BC4854|nr:Ldh family oxidoreductase [Oceanobacillus timonensis]
MTIHVSVEKLRWYCSEILKKNKIPEEEAEIIADSLVDANVIGVESHGVTRLADYLKRLENGIIENRTNLEIVKENVTTTLYDANNGWGQYAGKIAMQNAIQKAKKNGSAIVAVRNSNHFGTTSYFTRMATEENCIGIAMSNASSLMVSWGSKEPTLGTNPLSIAVPTNEHPAILDMATSNVARGKINLAVKNNQNIPEGWAITKDGEQTTDAAEALKGFLLPLGPKGSGLAMMIDIMTGVLTGALFGKDVPRMYDDPEPQQLGHLFIVLDIASFMDMDTFKQKMDDRIKQTTNSASAEGFEQVFMPGDIEQMKREDRYEKGIPLTQAIYEELSELGTPFDLNIKDIKM